MSVSRLRRNVGECARHHRLTIVFVLTIISLATVAGECCEEESETWSEDHPFGVFQQIWNCSTMGLRVGESAPPLPGITWTGTRSVVSFVTLASPPDQLAMVRSWSSFAGLQVVVIVVPRDEIDVGMSIAEFGNPELVLTGAVAGAAAHAFRVGYEPCPVTLLVGEDGVVAFRRRGFDVRCDAAFQRVVESFAGGGELPIDAVTEHVLWYGDHVPWPWFELRGLDDQVVELPSHRPVLVYFGRPELEAMPCPWCSELRSLAAAHPAVFFVWICPMFSTESQEEVWRFARSIGLHELHPHAYNVPLETFLEEAAASTRSAQVRRSHFAQSGVWTVVLDWEMVLARHWSLIDQPSIMIIDCDGRIAFPSTRYPVVYEDGERSTHPCAARELQSVLEGLDQ